MSPQPWWHPDALAARRPFLQRRAEMEAAIKGWFAKAGFIEVATPALQLSPGNETHLKAFPTRLTDPFGGPDSPLHLHTSPEFAMKKLLAGGMQRIHQMARVFRDGEAGPLHSPEFTMLEWYRAPGTLAEIMADTDALLAAAADGGPLSWQGHQVPADGPAERLSVDDAFQRHCGFSLLDTIADPFNPDPDPTPLADHAASLGIECAPTDRFEDIFFRLFLARIEPHLGRQRPTFLHAYPAALGALARRDPTDPRVVERFEVYVAGMELANAFGELTDPAEQRQRFEHDMALKEKLYGTRYPIDEDFLAALPHLPDCAGIALGIDRLAMLTSGANHIHQVLWAPVTPQA
ncbi:EF-P lysine aminoacylase EpmA [Roseospirillum parvum]|uniref:Lysyl-tRNA synthetase, class 2 n=1 Tax=Roseospirillum parvum TaxID=83401 RepID=A0A1G8A197_9PROT|nr:EF-P lysine aminoacylase EpmA [Roseospirillum parvum]SDH14663.1 lysyl-tRNA synthetase, class 2 [Roseospirillum parvum]